MKIHFKYVPGDTTEVEIKQFFAQVGPAYQIRLVGEPGNHRGFGFAKMSSMNGALWISLRLLEQRDNLGAGFQAV